jgi:dUTP pyrophosphatase
MIIKIKKLHDSAVIPQYAKAGDAGMDLTATSRELVDHGSYGYVEYGTSLSLEIPEGYVGLIFPRSSISKTGLVLANAVGVIDSGYRGEVKCRFKWIRDTALYEVGERIAQLIILPYPTIELQEAEALTETLRGENGFGSTGLN